MIGGMFACRVFLPIMPNATVRCRRADSEQGDGASSVTTSEEAMPSLVRTSRLVMVIESGLAMVIGTGLASVIKLPHHHTRWLSRHLFFLCVLCVLCLV